jgi:hypothetical protein
MYRTNVLPVEPIASTTFAERTSNERFIGINTEADILEYFNYKERYILAHDYIIPVNGEVVIAPAIYMAAYRVTDTGKDKCLKWKTKTVTHRAELVVPRRGTRVKLITWGANLIEELKPRRGE